MWTDETQDMAGGRGQFHVRASKGVHLLVPRDRIRADTGHDLRTEKSVLFVIPWGRHWIIGTTDTDWELDLAHPAASRADVDYLLDHVNACCATPLTPEDVEGVYAGLRPLLSGEADDTSQALPRARVVAPGAGPGRGRGRQVHDVPGDGQGRRRRGGARPADGKVPECVHRHDPAGRRRGLRGAWNERQQLAAASGLHVARIEHLLGRYGALSARAARPGRGATRRWASRCRGRR